MVGLATIDIAALICDPIPATSAAAADTSSGAVNMNDIADLQLIRQNHGGIAAGVLTIARTGEEFSVGDFFDREPNVCGLRCIVTASDHRRGARPRRLSVIGATYRRLLMVHVPSDGRRCGRKSRLKRIHYPSLNFLRFVAASIVVIHHIEQFKFLGGYPSQWNNPVIGLMGKLGVDLFFVLSGFLITSLLMIEKERFGKVHSTEFIIRRAYRIWPLYFLIVLVAFFAAPRIEFLQLPAPFTRESFALSLGLYILFLPHIQVFLIGPVAYCSQCWSIGIEECFYFIWPSLIHKLGRKGIVSVIFIFILMYCCAGLLMAHLGATEYAGDALFAKIHELVLNGLKFDCLLIGCFFALLNRQVGERRTLLTCRPFQAVILLVELLLIWKAYQFDGFYWEVHAVLYGFIVMNLVRRETSLVSFENKVCDYFGKISYGMYMYHPLVIGISVEIFCRQGHFFAVYPAVFGGTILISALSYRYIERYFLRRKLSHTYVQTG